MLRSLKDLERYPVSATDGDMGTVVNFLLDDGHWTVRYLIVDTGGFIGGRRVLVSPMSFRKADWSTHRFRLALTMDQIQKSPNVDTDKPVSRQAERANEHYYGYPSYRSPPTENVQQVAPDVHLRSASELRGYHIEGIDGAIGHIDDFVVDDETWEVRYLAIDTSNWWFGKKVLVPPQWASRVSWPEHRVHVELSRRSIENCPQWDATAAVNREYETRLYDYYGRPVYWANGDAAENLQPTTHA